MKRQYANPILKEWFIKEFKPYVIGKITTGAKN